MRRCRGSYVVWLIVFLWEAVKVAGGAMPSELSPGAVMVFIVILLALDKRFGLVPDEQFLSGFRITGAVTAVCSRPGEATVFLDVHEYAHICLELHYLAGLNFGKQVTTICESGSLIVWQ